MDNKQMIAPCGLYCNLCGQRSEIPKRASDLKEALIATEFDKWGGKFEGYNEFLKVIDRLINRAEELKSGCRGGCGPKWCSIRKCSIQKGVDYCPFCSEYPCHRIKTLSESETTLIHDGLVMKRHGVESWLEEMEWRKEEGFWNGEARCGKCNIPSE